MSLWLWVLVILSASGFVAAIAGAVMVLTGIVRLQRRLAALRQSPFVTRLESLQIQVTRLSRIASDSEELRRRAGVAIASLRNTPDLAGVPGIRNSWLECAAQMRAIVAELS